MSSVASPARLCHVRKRQDFIGYGFTLHAEKGMEGQFVGDVDVGSPAEVAGLKNGDKIVEVNGVNMLHEDHNQVVARIKGVDYETRILVVDQESWKIFQQQGIPVNNQMPNLVTLFSEPEEHFEYLARVCHLKKWDGFEGYGFNLHHHQDLDKHTIGKIDDESPARITGMIEGDYIVEVNGVNVEKSSHNDLVEMITEKAGGVNLLLVGALEHAMFLKKQVNVGGWMAQLRHLHCPAVNPYTTEQQVHVEQQQEQPGKLEQQPPQQIPLQIPQLKIDDEEQRKAEEEAIKAVKISLDPHRLRLTHLKLWGDGGGYGFNMQSEKKKVGQFISNVEINSPADYGGLKEGDMILSVNQTSLKHLKHQDVVSLIRSNPNETTLLLVDAVSKEYFEAAGLPLHDPDQMKTYVDTIVVPDSKPADNTTILKGLENKVYLKKEKPELILDVNNIQSSGIYNHTRASQSDPSVGSGGVPVNTNHVPSPTSVVGGGSFAGSAQEARQRLAKKKQASKQISGQARYELYKKL